MGAYKGKVSTKMVLDIYVLPVMLNISSKSHHVSVVWLEKTSLTKQLINAFQVSCGKCGNGLGHEFLYDGPKEGLSRF